MQQHTLIAIWNSQRQRVLLTAGVLVFSLAGCGTATVSPDAGSVELAHDAQASDAAANGQPHAGPAAAAAADAPTRDASTTDAAPQPAACENQVCGSHCSGDLGNTVRACAADGTCTNVAYAFCTCSACKHCSAEGCMDERVQNERDE
jgi:hypothetical protein